MLFDQLIQPIAVYGSDIWGPDRIKVHNDNRFKFLESLTKFTCESLNLSFSRFILGVHRIVQVGW